MDLIGLLKSQFLCHLVFCYVFIASGLIVNAIQLCTLVIWPINKQLFRKINARLCYCVSSRKIHSPHACFQPRREAQSLAPYRHLLGPHAGLGWAGLLLSLALFALDLKCPHSTKTKLSCQREMPVAQG